MALPLERYIAFHLLAVDDEVLLERPFAERRAALERSRRTGPRWHRPARARPHARRGAGRLPPRQGSRHGRLADHRALRRGRGAAGDRALLRDQAGGEAGPARASGRLRDRRTRPRRAEPLEERKGASVDRAASRAGRRGQLRPGERGAASATAPSCCAGARTSRPEPAPSTSCSPDRPSAPACAAIPPAGSPSLASRAGTVSMRSSAGSTPATSSQASGVETRASGVGRTL